ncbi:MAG: aldehyde dehydrogenase family protein [Phycisphaerales bacterium]
MSAAPHAFESRDPARPDEVVWRGVGDPAAVDPAVERARRVFPAWRDRPWEERAAFLRRWAEITRANAPRIAALITREMGKTLAESAQEAALLAEKVAVTLEEQVVARVRGYDLPGGATRLNRCTYRPLGAMAVVGPFNFPAHLPNGHWVPALLAGNTIVFKPSEKTPAVGELLGQLMREAGAPEGVFEVVQGGAGVAAALVAHDGIDGILFTGSWPVGRRILEANLDRPGRMVALEMGGSNAAVVLPDADLRQAVIECVRCAYLTTGQRCTCTRRILVHADVAERFIPAFQRCASTLVVGPGDAATPVFMGPLVTQQARESSLQFQRALAARGGRVLLESTAMDGPGWFVTPGLVQLQRFERAHDCENFGPVAQIAVVDSLEDAIAQSNASDFGLAASIFTRDADAQAQFLRGVRAGCINFNCGTAGASGKLPFGGLGRSGNLRPAGAAMLDSCVAPVASMIERGDAATVAPGMLAPERV